LAPLLEELTCRRLVVVTEDVAFSAAGNALSRGLAQARIRPEILRFPGECTAAAIADTAHRARGFGADAVLALGGGKAIDTAKGVAKALALRLIVMPTIASNDSPTSRLIVIYDDNHRVAGVDKLARNPDAVIVDTSIVARAPARFFAAGLGDALSKKAEAWQCHLAGGRNFFGTPSLPTARLLAERCYDTIAQYGAAALRRVRETGAPDPSVEYAVEASVLLSGLGFESGGLSLAHALTRGFTAHPAMSRMLHGELVAFGSIAQMLAQEAPRDEIQAHARLIAELGLPVTFAQLGEPQPSDALLDEIARLTCTAPYIGHLIPKADPARVAAVLREADRVGRGLGA
jgi:glycerol dehydrogenase